MDQATAENAAQTPESVPDIDTGTGIIISVEGLQPGMFEACSFAEMGVLFHVSKHTTYQWQARELLPEPDDHVSGRDLWHVLTLIRWGRHTGRTAYLHPDVASKYLRSA